jgi:hypothetical protein
VNAIAGLCGVCDWWCGRIRSWRLSRCLSVIVTARIRFSDMYLSRSRETGMEPPVVVA